MRIIKDRILSYLTGTVGPAINRITAPTPTNVTVKNVALAAYLRSTLIQQINVHLNAGSMGPAIHQALINVPT